MSEPTPVIQPPPLPGKSRNGLLWLILLLQVVILGWLAFNHLDGAFTRGQHNPPADVIAATPPSLEREPNAPSPSSTAADLSVPADGVSAGADADLLIPSAPELPRGIFPPFHSGRHPADRFRAEMIRMMQQANAVFADFADVDSFFSPGPAWSSLPASPVVDMRERPEAYELSLALPGLSPEQLDVQLDGRLLSIATHQDTRSAQSASTRRFHLRHLLPGPVDPARPVEITNQNNRVYVRVAKPVSDAPAQPSTPHPEDTP